MQPDTARCRAALLEMLRDRYPEGLTAPQAAEAFEGLTIQQAMADLRWLAARGHAAVRQVDRHRACGPKFINVYTAKVLRGGPDGIH